MVVVVVVAGGLVDAASVEGHDLNWVERRPKHVGEGALEGRRVECLP